MQVMEKYSISYYISFQLIESDETMKTAIACSQNSIGKHADTRLGLRGAGLGRRRKDLVVRERTWLAGEKTWLAGKGLGWQGKDWFGRDLVSERLDLTGGGKTGLARGRTWKTGLVQRQKGLRQRNAAFDHPDRRQAEERLDLA